MEKSYVVVEQGLIEKTIFYLKDQLTIGRSADNDISLEDPGLSKHHAVVFRKGKKAIIRDLGSLNGTFVNKERVSEAILKDKDLFQGGNITFQFVQSKIGKTYFNPEDTHRISVKSIKDMAGSGVISARSKRLMEALSKIPLFEGLNQDALYKISQLCRLRVYDEERLIVRQGDPGKSLFIILDGSVRVYVIDRGNVKHQLAILKANQFFGEMSFLMNEPRSACVQATSNTLVCELKYETIVQLVQHSPEIKNRLKEYCQARLKELNRKKSEAGIKEFRKEPRFNIRLSVEFMIPSVPDDLEYLKNKIYRTNSTSISESGIRVQVREYRLLRLPLNIAFRIKISLPDPWDAISCWGILRNIYEDPDEPGTGYFGLELTQMPLTTKNRLQRYIESASVGYEAA